MSDEFRAQRPQRYPNVPYLLVLREACWRGEPLVMGYCDKDGQASDRIICALAVVWPILDVCCQIGVSEAAYYTWKKEVRRTSNVNEFITIQEACEKLKG